MLYPIKVTRALVLITELLFLTFIAGTNLLAQSQPEERPRLKNFGSSLDRLQWDPDLNQAVEKKLPTSKAGPDDDDVIKVDTNLVTCSVTVLDQRGKVVPNLTREDFILTENGNPQDVYHFSLGNNLDVPRTIVLLIDYSSSQSPFIKESVAAAKVLADKLGPKDVMAIVTDDVELLVDFTRNKKELKKALDALYKKSQQRDFGKSKQFSALMAVIREMFTAEDVRPIVIFQTDGDQAFALQPSTPPLFGMPAIPFRSSLRERFSLRDLYHAIERSRASVYTVIPGNRQIDTLDSSEFSSGPLQQVAQRTVLKSPISNLVRWQQMAAAGAAIGGWTDYLQNPEDAPDIYRRILEEGRDGKRRQVQVEVRGHPEYTITGRKSYFAPPADQ